MEVRLIGKKVEQVISREKLIEDIKSKYCDSDFMDDGVITEFIDLINKQPQADKWIPVEERLPIIEREPSEYAIDVGERFLVTCEDGYVCERTFWKNANAFEEDVIAWMPKPNPYKKEGAE